MGCAIASTSTYRYSKCGWHHQHMLTPSLLACSGFHRFLDDDQTDLREKRAKLNPKTFPRNEPAPPPKYRTSTASPPAEKTTAFMLQAAREADQACADGIKRKRKTHPLHETGVHASHAMQKVPCYVDKEAWNPEPMHTTGNGANHCCDCHG